MSQIIKLCWFCKNKDSIAWSANDETSSLWTIRNEGENSYQVYCHDCEAHGPSAETEEEAIRLWNETDDDQ